MLGVPPERVFEALQVYLGSAFVNDFNLLGRTYHVTAQADAPFRRTTADIANLKTRSELGRDGADRIGRDLPGQDRPVSRDALQSAPAVEVDGDTAPGYLLGPVAGDDGEARRRRRCPRGYDTEWTGIAYQQKPAGNTAGLVFGAGGAVRLPGAGRAI